MLMQTLSHRVLLQALQRFPVMSFAHLQQLQILRLLCLLLLETQLLTPLQ